jgi:16S rRNA (adenine1518-N6/adenine1519-N6)-dimethyltransferase
MAGQRASFRPKKTLGQHFLIDPNTIRKIVAAVEAPPSARVVEIGPGQGALTGPLLERFPDLTAIEVDARAVSFLEDRFPGLDVRKLDVLAADWEDLKGHTDRPLYVVGNLPYNITSQILFGLMEAYCVDRAVLTMQREVAERLVALPRTKAYGILSVIVQLLTDPTVCFHLSPNVFYPKPDVWSSTVRLDWTDSKRQIAPAEAPHLRRVVRAAFNQRRKMLRNSLAGIVFERGIDLPDEVASKRAEELSPAEFLSLTRLLMAGLP